jgi:hypothetical protein
VTASPSRPSPYRLVFGAESLDDTLFPPIAGEAEARDVPLDDPDRFIFLTSVGRLIHAIAGTGGDDAGDAVPDEPGAGAVLRQHGRLLYHAFHHWKAGKREAELEEADVRRWLDADDVARDHALPVPGDAGYLRLPRNLVWAAPARGLRPEPADGFFWTYHPAGDGPAVLHVLLVLGVRADRPGFTVVAATGVADVRPHWADVDARSDGPDFASTLPGGEIDRLYSVETTDELLKLASRCLLALAGPPPGASRG